MEVRLIANAGVFIRINNKNVLVDALHCHKMERFSRVDASLLEEMIAGGGGFSHVDYLLVTHNHWDHHDAASVLCFMDNHPETTLITPTRTEDGDRVFNPRDELDFDGVSIRCARLVHEGAEYAQVVNYGYLIRSGGGSVLLLGDCATGGADIAPFIGGEKIDLALLNFPFITLGRGRKCMKEVIRPAKIGLFHLPFPKDDKENYIKVTKWLVERAAGKVPPCEVLCEENQILIHD